MTREVMYLGCAQSDSRYLHGSDHAFAPPIGSEPESLEPDPLVAVYTVAERIAVWQHRQSPMVRW